MRVDISDPALAGDLVTFLQRACCEASVTEEGAIEVAMPSVPDDAARLELDAYLQAWQALRPGATARRRCAYDL